MPKSRHRLRDLPYTKASPKRRQMHDLEDRVRQMESLLTASGLDPSALPLPPEGPPRDSDAVSSVSKDSATNIDFPSLGFGSNYGDSIAERTPSNSNPASCEATPMEPFADPVTTCSNFGQNPLCNGWNLPDHVYQHQHTVLDTGPTQRDLPPPHEATLLLQEYLEDWNKAIPLFGRDALVQIFQDCYAGREPEGSNAFLAVMGVLGLAHRLRGMSPVASPDDESLADAYKQHLLKAYPSLLMQDPSLLSVQCVLILGMLLYLSTDNNRAPYLVSTALRMMEPLGLGSRPSQALPDGMAADDQWVTLFWIAFALETELSLRYTRMPSWRLADLAQIELPPQTAAQGIGEIRSATGDGWSINFLRLRSELALIQARVCENVLATSTRNEDVDQAAGNLKKELEKWRSSSWVFRLNPPDLVREIHRSDLVLLTSLEANYLMTLFILETHINLRPKGTSGVWDPETILKIGLGKTPLCLADTRRFVAFLRVLPRGDVAWLYMVSHAIIAAIAILMSHATTNPEEDGVPPDIRISKAMLDVIMQLSKRCRTKDCRAIQQVCWHLYQHAESVVAKAVPRSRIRV
ncbi:uncharacterized protein HMPREF1541_10017 [Cyphellophora europaea CBS 101466]|uniref:Xylanolytic transcriptional activator regulatory domain-containing protein n=1 Tax=Cyphellophora europaea (strain CBS 101466) TaxID=1220924 RepID=W2S918_CYPE1|nr:uncharacterized protein HMPREF1541_10017 [Cyphellophora europaea CBS 101466]ETN45140.1 hypothetical protein HMPREF1541_10017 [Cyphellophora europaea CBS 101466]